MPSEETNNFTWNDLVTVKSTAPIYYKAGNTAVVCGMEHVKSDTLAQEFDVKIGDWIYTIEFGDGSSIEIPEIYLEKTK